MSGSDKIYEVIARYARSLDICDANAVMGCFTSTAQLSYEGGRFIIENVRDLQSLLEKTLIAPSTHLFGNYTLEKKEGRALVQCSAIAIVMRTNPASMRGLTYEFECVEGDNGWLIDRLRHSLHWELPLPALPSPD